MSWFYFLNESRGYIYFIIICNFCFNLSINDILVRIIFHEYDIGGPTLFFLIP